MKRPDRLLSLILPAAALVLSLLALRPWARPAADLEAFSRLPVLQGGRVKPVDTLASSTLLMLSGRTQFAFRGRRISAVEWLLDTLTNPAQADLYPVFVLEDLELRGLLGLEKGGAKRLSFLDLEPHFQELRAQLERAEKVEPAARSRFQSAVLNLGERLSLYNSLKNTVQVAWTKDMPKEIESFLKAVKPGMAALHAHQSGGKSFNRKALDELGGYFERYQSLHQAAYFWPLPPLAGRQEWSSIGQGLLAVFQETHVHPAAPTWAQMSLAWRLSRREEFSEALLRYHAFLGSEAGGSLRWARYERWLNQAQPFYLGMMLYVAGLLCAFASWLAKPEALRGSAFRILVVAFILHTAGLTARMIIQGRPPVTNLYSSAVFVGWVAAGLAVLLEHRGRTNFGNVTAGITGFTSLVVAHHLANQGDTVEMMRAVLDSNFWLTTHVVTITMGYGGMFLASAFAHAAVLRAPFASWQDSTSRNLASMTYGTLCFSLLFSFAGTVLGGIWADQSWGRFWGWDPKENGALLIVLWVALILHARWAGYVRERGLMVMAIFGGVVTSFAWFGVNMLGVGLHSYGFMGKAFTALSAFIAAELLIMAAAVLPNLRQSKA
ncbi:MAG: cytochrome c biogenesis protein CcsA [Elusimicrobia bacterium]|nr:cytochrome c biogenesis protein CcsA [Elusimicrobiota bacterium]